MVQLKYTTIECGSYRLDFSKETLIMGILNVTPDSFSDGGDYVSVERAIEHAKQLVEDGAHIIDVGGESTRPGAKKVTEEEELKRVIPIIKALSKVVQVPISIDTYKANVARQAIEAGAHIINDVWGAKAQPEIAKVAAEYKVPIILMHNRTNAQYGNLMIDVLEDINESIQIAVAAGVTESQIILDPGIGFAKTFEENVVVMQGLDQIRALGYPVLLGTSRKSMIGRILDVPPKERVEGTQATVDFGIMKGTDIVRVHDVKEIARGVKVMDVLVGKRRME